MVPFWNRLQRIDGWQEARQRGGEREREREREMERERENERERVQQARRRHLSLIEIILFWDSGALQYLCQQDGE